jgi:hypothetical protein
MPTRRIISLSDDQLLALSTVVRTHTKAYVRERAAAILKIAEGTSPHAVAKAGVLLPRAPDTVYRWLTRYETDGVAGLLIKPGRGRKAAFSPSAPDRRARARGPAARRPTRPATIP